MTLSKDSFGEYFAALNDGHPPYAWQQRLLDQVVQEGRWPEAIVAPTGLGKSAVVDIHIFANALAASGGARVPRRMSVVVNRRALVDKHLFRAEQIANALKEAESDDAGVLSEVAAALRGLARTTADQAEALVKCVSIRGGLPTDPSWIDDPRVVSVIAATPDMWGSRLLFRGYSSSRRGRPREAGLLAYDSVLVLDEAHLNDQLLKTARDVAAIVEDERSGLGGIPGLQVLATTATPNEGLGSTAAGIQEWDADCRGRLDAPKRVSLVASSKAPTKMPPSQAYIEELAGHALELAADADSNEGSGTVLCVVNNVETAIRLAKRLHTSPASGTVVGWVGRMREMDLAKTKKDHPLLFTPEGDPHIRFLVATQTVEVGIDLDYAAMLTELAPGTSLVQRFGRVNRQGARPRAEIRVIAPAVRITADRLPYRAEDLEKARRWLEDLPDGNVSPWAVREFRPPAQSRKRMLISPLHRETARLLACTSDPLFEEPDLSFWLREDLEPEMDPVGVVQRKMVVGTPAESPLADDGVAFGLLAATPVDAREVFPTSIPDARQVVARVLAAEELARVFYWRDDELAQAGEEYRVAPGDVLVLDIQHSVTRERVVTADPPKEAENPETVWGPAGVRVELGESAELCQLLAGVPADDAQRVYDELGREGHVQVLVPDVEATGDTLPWVVLKDHTVVDADSEVRQEWSGSEREVLLDEHQAAVASRARELAEDLGLPRHLALALEESGRHHDDGKVDPRFQRVRFSHEDASRPLAKSGRQSAQATLRNRSNPELPRAWRHEQLSAVSVWSDPVLEVERDLITRLVGTSHGCGRPFFPHGVPQLLADEQNPRWTAAAKELFATGAGWSGVLGRTEHDFGIWGCAYLEALLRAADCQVSREGS